MSDLIPQDPEQRTLVVGVAVAVYYAISAWSQVLVWPASQAPHYKYGWQVSIGLWILVIIMTLTLRWIDMRYMLPKRIAFAKKVKGTTETRRSSDELANDLGKDSGGLGSIVADESPTRHV